MPWNKNDLKKGIDKQEIYEFQKKLVRKLLMFRLKLVMESKKLLNI